jgi:hypothetical protein
MGGNGNGSTVGIEIVVCSGQSAAYKCLFEFPLLGGFFFYAGAELHKVPAADLSGEAKLNWKDIA